MLELEDTEWFNNSTNCYPPCFTERTVKLFPTTIAGESGEKLYSWEGRKYTEMELEEKFSETNFPNLKRADKSTPQETQSFRIKQTNDPKIIEQNWSYAKRIPFPSNWTGAVRTFMDTFKTDMYGNVISLRDTSDHALTKFDVDHIFPWSRGGRSVMENFAPVQNVANRAVKNDTMIQLLDPGEMACGMQVRQLLALVTFIVKECETSTGRGSRKTLKSKLDEAESWLKSSPPNGTSWAKFQTMVDHTSDGEKLFHFFSVRKIEFILKFFPERKIKFILKSLVHQPDDIDSAATGSNKPINSEDKRLISRPGIDVIISSWRIECYNCYAIRETLKDELHMIWDQKRKCWWKNHSANNSEDSVDVLIARIQIAANSTDCSVNIILNYVSNLLRRRL